jgi:thiamine biosynthesis lipoprotein
VAAASCLEANTAATAAIVQGIRAVAWLKARRLPARLVDRSGHVLRLAGWPAS